MVLHLKHKERRLVLETQNLPEFIFNYKKRRHNVRIKIILLPSNKYSTSWISANQRPLIPLISWK